MAKKLPSVDVLLVGFGWTGAILGQELTDTGLQVLALERGGWRDTTTDFATTFIQDELRYYYRYELFQEPARETLTFRNNASQTALPMRHLGSFLPGAGVGGAGIHWNGQNWRFLPTDFMVRSQTTQRYGAQMIPQDMTIQDWGVTYDELEPYYDKWEYLCGISGKAGNIKGQIQPGGNPFEGPRSRDYPKPADGDDLRAGAVRARRRKTLVSTHSRRRPRTCPAPTQTPSACNSDRAPIAAFAKSSAAAITPRRARRRRYCRCSCASPTSRSRPKAR